MDIHRCRFVQYPPEPINALAFSHSSNPKRKTPSELRLALGRNNGDIEIWDPRSGLWVQETILRGSKNTTIEQLAWTQDLLCEEENDSNAPKTSRGPLRLFSTGGSTSVTEWDLSTGAPRSKAEGNFGDIWCFAAQPQLEDAESPEALKGGAGSQLLAAGCSDGTIILFSTEDDDLRYLRPLVQLPVKKPKVLSLVWRDRNTLLAGCEDSTIRVIDVLSRRIIRNMSLGKPVEGNNSVVWTVKCLPSGAILSGDSSGELKIWDSKNYSLVQRLKSHKADILDIATSASGDAIFSVGVDRRTVTYRMAPLHSGTQRTRWAEVAHKRFHQHDVKCAASFESKELSILVSGGMDAQPVIVPIRHSQTEYHRALPHLPQQSQISASPISRMFISWWDREIVVYHVRKFSNLPEADLGPDGTAESRYETLTSLVLQGDQSIQDAQISRDGRLVVAATTNNVKMFQLRKTHVSGKPCLRTRQIELPPSVARLGARRVGFSPDGKWLYCVRKDNALVMVKILPSNDPKDRPVIHEKIVKLYRQPRKTTKSALGSYLQLIKQVAFSTDSRVLSVGDLSGAIDVWVLEGYEDVHFVDDAASDPSDSSASSTSSTTSDDEDDDSSSPIIHGQKWMRNPSGSSLPQLDSSILALTFRPSQIIPKRPSFGTNLGLHATRHNPHAVSHEPLDEANTKLMAVTAKHQLVEFDISTAKLSDWSRRNPSKFLPHDFTRIKDRVVGCFWDCNDRATRGERLWLYGSVWMFMFDVSRDLLRDDDRPKGATNDLGEGEVEQTGRLGRYEVVKHVVKGDDQNRKGQTLPELVRNEKRERHNTRRRKRKRGTGAGDEIHLKDREGDIGIESRRFKDASGNDAEMIDLDTNNTANEMDLDDELDEDERQDDVLALMRRGESASAAAAEVVTDEQTTTSVSAQKCPRMYWYTFEYHSILGIEVIGPAEPSPTRIHITNTDTGYATIDVRTAEGNKPEQDGNARGNVDENPGGNIEVIVVERPMFDVELPPRFDDGQDWDV